VGPSSAISHDPKQLLEGLRNLLASSDKRIIFLFGAGGSSAVKVPDPAFTGAGDPDTVALIPAVDALTDTCGAQVEGIGSSFKAAWDQLVAGCVATGQKPQVESLLSRLRVTIAAADPGSTALGLTTDELAVLERKIQETVAKVTSPAEDLIPDDLPHNLFARWVRGTRRAHGVEIFTTNYDVLLERSLERANVHIFDGFVGSYEPFFSPNLVAAPRLTVDPAWVGLWKLHGSVTWASRPGVPGRPARVVRPGLSPEGMFIYPSDRKYDESRKMPYVALMERFRDRLNVDGTLLVTVGYSWGDDHLNAAILDALDEHPSVNAFALMYSDVGKNPRLVEYATERKNLHVIGGRTAIIGGRTGAWTHLQALDNLSSKIVDLWFDTDGGLPDVDSIPGTGRMRLGDFKEFAAFLSDLDLRAWTASS